MKKVLIALLLISTQLVNAEEVKPKKKIVKKVVTTYEEVDDESTPQNTNKSAPSYSKNVEASPSEGSEKSSASTAAHLDLMAGYVLPIGDMGDAVKGSVGLGGQLLFNVSPDFSVGGYFLTNTSDAKDYDNISLKFNYYGLVSQYKMSSMSFFQFKVGMSSLTLKGFDSGFTFSVSSDAHPYTVEAGLGLDFPITSTVSFSPYASFLHSFKSTTDSSEVDPYNTLNIMGSMKVNF